MWYQFPNVALIPFPQIQGAKVEEYISVQSDFVHKDYFDKIRQDLWACFIAAEEELAESRDKVATLQERLEWLEDELEFVNSSTHLMKLDFATVMVDLFEMLSDPTFDMNSLRKDPHLEAFGALVTQLRQQFRP